VYLIKYQLKLWLKDAIYWFVGSLLVVAVILLVFKVFGSGFSYFPWVRNSFLGGVLFLAIFRVFIGLCILTTAINKGVSSEIIVKAVKYGFGEKHDMKTAEGHEIESFVSLQETIHEVTEKVVGKMFDRRHC